MKVDKSFVKQVTRKESPSVPNQSHKLICKIFGTQVEVYVCMVYYKLLFELFLGIMELTVGVCKKSVRK